MAGLALGELGGNICKLFKDDEILLTDMARKCSPIIAKINSFLLKPNGRPTGGFLFYERSFSLQNLKEPALSSNLNSGSTSSIVEI